MILNNFQLKFLSMVLFAESKFLFNKRFFSSLSYPIGIKNTLNSLKWMAQMSCGKMSVEKFMELNTFYFKDELISKNYVHF